MEKLTKSYKQAKITGNFDVIIIGSGVGGMSTASFLTKEGKKVLVLERHYMPGGYTQIFKRRDYEWDTGVHYVGEIGVQNSMLNRVFKYVSDGSLHWEDMGEVYDKMIFGDKVYEFHKGIEEFKTKLKEYFPSPEDVKSIDDYVDAIMAAQRTQPLFFSEKAMPLWLSAIFGRFMRNKALAFNKPTLEILSAITKNPKLIAVLTGQFGDYGLPPSKSSFYMHSALVKHYFRGGSYPVGGSQRIFESIAAEVVKGGGEIFTNAEVQEVIVKNNVAIGVRMKDGKEIFANQVVSTTGVLNTLNRLLPDAVKQQHKISEVVSKVTPSVGYVCLYIGIKESNKTLGLGKSNYWIFPDNYDHDKNIENYLNNPDSEIPVVYISFPSVKDSTWEERYPNKTTIQIVTLAPYEWYSQWENTEWKKRGADYEAAKEKMSQRLLEALYKQEPTLRGKIDYYELSTPLSTKHFTNYQKGELYGLEHNTERFTQKFLRIHSPVKKLYMAGQDIITCGIGGAFASGLLTASSMLRRNLQARLPEKVS
jgi:all-trans-retinol 13,14-reductase